MTSREVHRMIITGWSPELRADVRKLCTDWLARHENELSRRDDADHLRRIRELIDEVNDATGGAS